jgi:hypothetical protein
MDPDPYNCFLLYCPYLDVRNTDFYCSLVSGARASLPRPQARLPALTGPDHHLGRTQHIHMVWSNY